MKPLAFSTNAISVWFHGILKDSRTSDVIHNTVTSASGVSLVVLSSVGVPLCDGVCAMTSLTMSSLLTSQVLGDDDSVLSASDAMQAETGGSIALEVVKLGYVTSAGGVASLGAMTTGVLGPLPSSTEASGSWSTIVSADDVELSLSLL